MIDITTTNKLCIECAHCADMSLRPWTARDKSWVWRPGNEAGSVQVIGKSTHLADVNWFATADLHTSMHGRKEEVGGREEGEGCGTSLLCPCNRFKHELVEKYTSQ